jgi:uncharacterized membrane protein
MLQIVPGALPLGAHAGAQAGALYSDHAGYDASMAKPGTLSGRPGPAHIDPTPAAARMKIEPQPRLRWTRNLTWTASLALILLGLGWELWWAPTGSGTLAVKVIPLLPALPGLWRYRLYTYRWLSLLVWLYAGEGLLRATSETGPSVALAWAELALSLVVFTGCVLHVRARARAQTQPGANGAADGTAPPAATPSPADTPWA